MNLKAYALARIAGSLGWVKRSRKSWALRSNPSRLDGRSPIWRRAALRWRIALARRVNTLLCARHQVP